MRVRTHARPRVAPLSARLRPARSLSAVTALLLLLVVGLVGCTARPATPAAPASSPAAPAATSPPAAASAAPTPAPVAQAPETLRVPYVAIWHRPAGNGLPASAVRALHGADRPGPGGAEERDH